MPPPLVYYPDPVLQNRAKEVDPRQDGLGPLAVGMVATMREEQGVGLAAPQVGESLRLFVASGDAEAESVLVCVNPRVEAFGPIVEMEEGCLSVPGFRAQIRRPEAVRVTYLDLDGVERTGEFHELMARVIQHEYDHLEGVLFFERMTEADRVQCRPHLKALEEQYRPR
ncbi:MAG: peptide deformylase [Planctomycetota bacterium]|jgi:peptide deformylase